MTHGFIRPLNVQLDQNFADKPVSHIYPALLLTDSLVLVFLSSKSSFSVIVQMSSFPRLNKVHFHNVPKVLFSIYTSIMYLKYYFLYTLP